MWHDVKECGKDLVGCRIGFLGDRVTYLVTASRFNTVTNCYSIYLESQG